MKKNLAILISFLCILFFGFGVFGNDEKILQDKIKNKFTSSINKNINNITNSFAKFISTKKNVKHLEINTEFKDNEKFSFGLLNVNKILEKNNLVFFNQNSLSINDDQTLNLGLGVRNLIHDDKIIIGTNIFYDHSFQENHKRNGIGVEGKSSLLDVTYNYYNAITGKKTTSNGSEEALDGSDFRLDYHIPIKGNIDVFVNFFEFENAKKTYKQEGTQIGFSSKLENIKLEAGYQDDNKGNDGGFLKIAYVINLGKVDSSNSSDISATQMVSVKDRLYEPVKRENKIRLVKINKSGVTVSGF